MDKWDCPALHSAVENNLLSEAQVMLEKDHANPNHPTAGQEGNQPLHTAVLADNIDMAKLLLQHGADVNGTNQRNWAPLICAIQKHSVPIIHLLLLHHADVNIPTDTLETALHKSCWQSNLVMVEMMLQHGANVNAQDASGRTPLHCAYDKMEIIRRLVEEDANVNLADHAGETPLFYCVRQESLETARYLLESTPAQVDVANEDGLQVLHVASTLDLPTVELLVTFGANVNATSTSNVETALHVACREGPVEIISFLLARGANIARPSTATGQTALHIAAELGRIPVVQLLLEQQLRPQHIAMVLNAVTRQHQTALHLSSAKGNLVIVSMLIRAHADVRALDEQGRTAFDVACENGHLDVLFYFLRENNWTTCLLDQD